MTYRTVAYNRICNAAVEHFSINGYDGASLNEIANMVGIRKASLYSHFSSKDALYLQILDDAVAIESDFVINTFKSASNASEPGESYSEVIAQRYKSSVYLRYLLRTVYIPPFTLKNIIGKAYEKFISLLHDSFIHSLRQSSVYSLSEVDLVIYGRAYIGIIESLFIEFVYVSESSVTKRREALWRLLIDSLSLHKREVAISPDD